MAAELMGRTLEDFGAEVDAFTGLGSFARTVRDLAAARAVLKAAKARRAEIWDAVAADAVTRSKSMFTVSTPEGHWVVKRTPERRVSARVLDTSAVKRRYPSEYEAARVLVPWVSVRGSVEAVPMTLPSVPTSEAGRVLAWAQWKVDEAERAKVREAALIAKLRGIAAAAEWDGLPVQFSDGWVVGVSSLRFQAKNLDPKVAAECMVEREKVTPAGVMAYLGTTGDEADEYAP